jgi:hypothetical protein
MAAGKHPIVPDAPVGRCFGGPGLTTHVRQIMDQQGVMLVLSADR